MSDFQYESLNPPARILLGPGPSNIHPRVQTAMLAPMVGHLDPYFITIMEDTCRLMRAVFQTDNRLTFPVSGTGSAGMETAFDNFLEEGDTAVIGVSGLFGERMVDNAQRTGARVVPVTADWGDIIEAGAVEKALKAEKKVKLVAVVHAETSTGALQPLEDISALCKQYGALLLVDTVTSLGGHPVAVDDWGIDICFSGTQKCLSCPPGLSPFSVNAKALEVLKKRAAKVKSWYLDLNMLSNYWSEGTRLYHHTAPISMIYALHEALAIIMDDGLEARLGLHARNGSALQAGLEAMGLVLHAREGYRLHSLTTVRVPGNVDELRIRQRLLKEYNIEIGAGLGPLKGKVWRIGLMGHSCTAENVLLFLAALGKLLSDEDYKATGDGIAAALEVLQQ